MVATIGFWEHLVNIARMWHVSWDKIILMEEELTTNNNKYLSILNPNYWYISTIQHYFVVFFYCSVTDFSYNTKFEYNLQLFYHCIINSNHSSWRYGSHSLNIFISFWWFFSQISYFFLRKWRIAIIQTQFWVELFSIKTNQSITSSSPWQCSNDILSYRWLVKLVSMNLKP